MKALHLYSHTIEFILLLATRKTVNIFELKDVSAIKKCCQLQGGFVP